MSNQFWFGTVENRDDPLKIGRYKVRVVGIHTADKTELPTEDLPWATTLQPTTSAAMSGIGCNPGLVNGSWVMVVFTSSDYQVPIIIGSVAGIPGVPGQEIASDGQSAPPPEEATPTQKAIGVQEGVYDPSVLNPESSYLGSLTKAQYDQFARGVRMIESSNNYLAVNQLGYAGAYQFGAAALEDLGYIKKGSWARVKKNSLMDESDNWTGKDGCISKTAFLVNFDAQDKCMLLYSQRAYKLMSLKGQVSEKTDPRILAGLLGAAHNQGTGAIASLLRGETTKDGNGTTAKSYYDKCYRLISISAPTILAPDAPAPIPDENEIVEGTTNLFTQTGTVSNATPKANLGFSDPEGIYPTMPNEADLNRVVRGQSIDKTVVAIKEKERLKNIGIGLSDKSWDQPSIQYAAQYPFNHAYVSEKGHMLEFDDTHKAERVHLYHRTGTFVEIDQGGNQVNKIVGHNVTVTERDGYVYIKGNGHLNIEGSFTLQTDTAYIEMTKLNIKTEKTVWETDNIDFRVKDSFKVDAKTISFNSSGLMKSSAGGNNEISSGAQVSISSGGISSIDGSAIYLNSGKKANSIVSPTSPIGKFSGEIMNISAASRSDSDAAAIDDNPHAAIINADSNAESPPATVESIAVTTPAPTASDSGETKTFDLSKGMNIQLSPNYKLKDLCVDGGFSFAGQHGLTANQIINNLSKLCVNVLEPVRAKYGNSVKVNSGFRPAGSPVSKSKGVSQHETGEAVDIGFMDVPRGSSRKSGYFDRAKTLSAMLPYDQFLFESRTGGDTVWIHVSYSASKQRKQVMTLVNDKVVMSGSLALYV